MVQGWSSAMGTVLASHLERRRSGDSGSVNYPVVQYSYQVGGQTYQGAKIAPGMDVGGTGAGRIVEKISTRRAGDGVLRPEQPV
ncbi:MAG: DUF3592 domain-containing protein [Anaerolineales bacterium]